MMRYMQIISTIWNASLKVSIPFYISTCKINLNIRYIIDIEDQVENKTDDLDTIGQ